MRIGELARRAGVTSRAVRNYHAAGLLPEPARDGSGHRSYGQADLDVLLQIGRLRAEGRTLDEIGAALGADSTRRPR
ncbi:MAG: hypothetical protein QOI76_4097 [Frankiales bacterium]|nr:hypothetical protein [Frankiales bacterium]